jgi:hypothetical protein
MGTDFAQVHLSEEHLQSAYLNSDPIMVTETSVPRTQHLSEMRQISRVPTPQSQQHDTGDEPSARDIFKATGQETTTEQSSHTLVDINRTAQRVHKISGLLSEYAYVGSFVLHNDQFAVSIEHLPDGPPELVIGKIGVKSWKSITINENFLLKYIPKSQNLRVDDIDLAFDTSNGKLFALFLCVTNIQQYWEDVRMQCFVLTWDFKVGSQGLELASPIFDCLDWPAICKNGKLFAYPTAIQ